MAGYRQVRINDQLVRELSEIIRTVKDPRVSSSLVSITAADCTADLKLAKIYFSSIGGEDAAEIKRGLVSASGYIRTQLAQRLNLRVTPELKFIVDESIEKGARMDQLFKEIEKTMLPDSAYDTDDDKGE